MCTSSEKEEAATSGKEEGKSSSESKESPTEDEAASDAPRVLWEASRLTKEFEQAEHTVNMAAVASGGGIGAALLGIAPFTAPNPFMVALLIASFQVHLAHRWQMRQLNAQIRRHVLKVTEDEEGTLLILKFDGNLTRSLRLTSGTVRSDDDKRPTLAEVFEQSKNIIYFDNGLGKSEAQELLDAVIQSNRGIVKEELTIKPMHDEAEDELTKVVQRLDGLMKKDLEQLAKSEASPPKTELAKVVWSAQVVAGIILTGGIVIGVGGRSAAVA